MVTAAAASFVLALAIGAIITVLGAIILVFMILADQCGGSGAGDWDGGGAGADRRPC